MKAIAFLFALLALIPLSVAAENNASVAVLPGSLDVTLTVEKGQTILTVDDATGSGRGWWVTVSCACGWVRTGEVQTLAGDAIGEPQWKGATLIADADEGMGIYRQVISVPSGDLVVTSGQGDRP